MATSTSKPKQKAHKEGKRPRLPSNAKVTKRPLLRPPIPSAFMSADHPKVIYLSARTPFIPTVKRVQSLLRKVEDRNMQSLHAVEKRDQKAFAHKLEQTVGAQVIESQKQNRAKKKSPRGEEIFIKATGRAIEKALSIALFFQQKGDVNVRVSTGTVDAVDDIDFIPVKKSQAAANPEEMKEDDDQHEQDIPESRVRKISMIEIAISLR